MKNKEIMHALSSVQPRRYQNKTFGYMFLMASVITVILVVVFFLLASKRNDNFGFNMFQYLAYLMILATILAICIGIFFVVMNKNYMKKCKIIYENGEKFNATIVDILEKKETSQNRTVYRADAIKYSFTVDNLLIEATTKYIFDLNEIEYFKTLNFFPILYNKERNQYLYFIYM